jgi:hypothetical protein
MLRAFDSNAIDRSLIKMLRINDVDAGLKASRGIARVRD